MKLTPITNAMKVSYLKLHGVIPEDFSEEQNLSPAQHNRFIHDLMLRTSMTQDKLTLLVKYLETLPAHVRHMFESNKVSITPVLVPTLPPVPPQVEQTQVEQNPVEQNTAVTEPPAADTPAGSDQADTSSEEPAKPAEPAADNVESITPTDEVVSTDSPSNDPAPAPDSSVLEIADGASTKTSKKKGK
jgi:hypothetical protein